MHEGDRFIFNDVKRDVVLLVEGIDDARFFEALLTWLGRTDAVQIAQVGGRTRFDHFLTRTLTRAENFYRLRRLGLIRDADKSAQSAFNSLCGALSNANLPAPARAWEIRQEGDLHVGVAILPDMDSCWNLEALCLRSLEEEELSCIDAYVDCVARTGPSIANEQLEKARLYTYLAAGPVPRGGSDQAEESPVRGNPGLRLGESAEAGVWNWNSPAFEQIRDWLCNLADGS